MGSRKNIRNKNIQTYSQLQLDNYNNMFFNYPTMFETPMFYQTRPSYYQRRPRNVYRRQQPERSFSFSPFMSELDDLYGYPNRQQTNENECNCGNCRRNFQRKADKSEPENQTLNVQNSENEKIPESQDLQRFQKILTVIEKIHQRQKVQTL